MRRVLTATVVALLAGWIGWRDDDIASRWWSHVEALANDGMEGRNTGSRAHKRAADYVAAQFKKSGLEPAGVGGHVQPVQFRTRRIVEAKSSLALVKNGKAEPFTLGEDANISVRVDPAPAVEAPLVFIGYGLNILERNINDFAGVNLKDAIVVYVSSTPKSLPGPLQAHFGTAAERWRMYQAAGAIGTVSIANPKSMDIPWSRSTSARLQPAMSLADAALEEKGELGSRYFAAHPTVPRASMVANVNIDMFLPLFQLKMLMVLGLDESDLGNDIRATAKAVGVTVQADPEPQRNRFVRSDQYSFVKVGIPALAMKVGYDVNTPEAAIAAKWTVERYHAPSDDLNQPIDRSAAGKYVEVVRDLAVRIANRTDRPKCNNASFFKRFAGDATH